MLPIPYDKIKNLVQGVGSYRLVEEGNSVTLFFTPPTLREAAGVDEDVKSLYSQYVIEFEKQDNYLFFKRAYILRGNEKRELTEDEISLWLQYLLDM